MHTALMNSIGFRSVVLVGLIAGRFAISARAAELMPPTRQNALVQQYCAVCHTDAAKNGGLSLEHYDAAQADPALAAMLLSKLRNGAMGAAGSWNSGLGHTRRMGSGHRRPSGASQELDRHSHRGTRVESPPFLLRASYATLPRGNREQLMRQCIG